MNRRPVIIDLFCGAGGAAAGLRKAGLDVFGVDIKPQPRYPGPMIVADAMEVLADFRFMSRFDGAWASPPCQGYTSLRHAPGARGAPKFVGQIIESLSRFAKPWIVENIESAEVAFEMGDHIRLCGTMFGLGARGAELQRHRLFKANFAIHAPCGCRHSGGPVLGVYGGHARIRSARHGGRTTRDDWGPEGHRPVAAEAMGMPWATLAEMSEAIPPAYAAHLGSQMLRHIRWLDAQ